MSPKCLAYRIMVCLVCWLSNFSCCYFATYINPAGIYLLKVSNRNTRTMFKINNEASRTTLLTFSIFLVSFEQLNADWEVLVFSLWVIAVSMFKYNWIFFLRLLSSLNISFLSSPPTNRLDKIFLGFFTF